MANTLPALKIEQEVLEHFGKGAPMQRLLGATLERLGGVGFVEKWAEENPSEFMRMLMASQPLPSGGNGSGGPTINLNMHPSLVPGPLDAKGQTYDHD